MHMRVVRFTDVDPERVEKLVSEMDESAGPPEDIKATALQMVTDEDLRTAVVVQVFDSAEDMREAAFDAMDASETPGTRASVDRGEVKLDLKMSGRDRARAPASWVKCRRPAIRQTNSFCGL